MTLAVVPMMPAYSTAPAMTDRNVATHSSRRTGVYPPDEMLTMCDDTCHSCERGRGRGWARAHTHIRTPNTGY